MGGLKWSLLAVITVTRGHVGSFQEWPWRDISSERLILMIIPSEDMSSKGHSWADPKWPRVTVITARNDHSKPPVNLLLLCGEYYKILPPA